MAPHLILAEYLISKNYTFTIGGYRFGLEDAEYNGTDVTLLHAGPLGNFHHVPFTATQGSMITALLLATALATVGWLCFRRQTRLSPPTNN